MFYKLLSGLLIFSCINITALANNNSLISFDELFVMDRDKALKELVPGTEEYYHYNCLHYQGTGDKDKFDSLMKNWFKKFGESRRYTVMLNRQALLDFEKDPRKSLDHIIKELTLTYNYQKIAEERKIQYPNELDPKLISWETVSKTNIYKITDAGLERYAAKDLDPDERRRLLKRVTNPGFPNLPKLIIDDLNYKNAGQFGYLKIHKLLTLEQLDECLKLKKDLDKYSQFVNIYITRLRPANHINWEQDDKHKAAYLDTLWKYVSELAPAFNSLKAHTLLHKLNHERSLGKYDEDLFMEYLKLPKNVHYINDKYIKQKEFRHVYANLSTNYISWTGLAPVQTIENQLTLDFFEQIFIKADDFRKFNDYVDARFLENTFAEVKILHGIGDAEKWYAKFKNSSYVKTLKDRIELRMLPQNSDYIKAADKISLKVAVKNVPKLLIKTYKINLYNYYKRYQKQVSTDIDLDGLVAANERTVKYSQAPQIRHIENFDINLKDNGIYIVELIGNGISSRALIRKGQFRFTVAQSAAGHIFTVYDEDNNQVKDAEIHLSGHIYKAAENGSLIIPYTKSAGNQKIIIKRGNFSSLGEFQHSNEAYKLNAGFYINREELVKNGTATLIVRPELLLNGIRINNQLLKNVKLIIRSTDSKGVSSSINADGFKLNDTRESSYTISVPEGIRNLSWTLSAEIDNMTDGKTVNLYDSSSIELNSSQNSAIIADAYLLEKIDGYYVQLLGRTGEALEQQAVNISLHHKFVRDQIHQTLKTNDKGEVKLGKLDEILSISASNSSISRNWTLHNDLNLTVNEINSSEDAVISIPFNWDDSSVEKQASLIELRNGIPVKLKTDKIARKDGYLEISKLEAGDYRLYLKKSGAVISITTLKGIENKAYILSEDRYIRRTDFQSPVISGISKDGEGLKINIKNATPRTRIHVLQTRFSPNQIPGIDLAATASERAHVYDFSRNQSHYLSERNIGDEYRYILTRRSGRIYPGNMLDRPGLLLNPWILRSTSTGVIGSDLGGAYGGRSSAGRRGSVSRFGASKSGLGRGMADSGLDFLMTGKRTLVNLVPDKNGIIKIDKAGHGQSVHVVLVDGYNLQYKKTYIEEDENPYRDLRLKLIMNPDKHFVERKKISVLNKGKDFTLNSISSAKVESYNSLRKVYHLMKTLNPDGNLTEFSFILDWPGLDDNKKLELYSKYACHELNFFIYKKDPVFFNKIIVPYMTNKKGNTFLDHWLKDTDYLQQFTQEWKYSRLNTVEKILLAKRNNSSLIKREMQDHFDILKRDRNKLNYFFNSAVQSEKLSGSGKDKGNYKAILEQNMKREEAKAVFSLAENSIKGISRGKKKAARAPSAEKEAQEDFEQAADDPFADEALVLDNKANNKPQSLAKLRERNQQFYREVGSVNEWVENNYYKLPIEQHVANLVDVNAFWNDFAAHTSGPFVSAHFTEATGNFTEMMFALSVLDLPFEEGEIDSRLDEGKLVLKPDSDLILFHREIEETEAVDNTVILTKQKYFDISNRYKMDGNEKVEKYITEEFETGKVYGARVIINNPSAANRKIEVLTQLPQGAIPVKGSQETMTSLLNLSAYSNQVLEYYFYFPFAGKFDQFPVHVSQEGKLLGYEKPFKFNVVDELTIIDKESWIWISQNASSDEVIDYLKNNNLNRINLRYIAWRMKDQSFAKRALSLLSQRNHFDYVSYSFALKHNITNEAAEFVKFSPFANSCGTYLDAPVLTIDPVERFSFQHREYSPLVNARTYKLGSARKIPNREFRQQYNNFMEYLTYKLNLTAEDRLSQVYYLLLQDRIDEGINLFSEIKKSDVTEKMQYDYMNAYIQFYLEKPEKAEVIATAYKNYPVVKWRKKFEQVIAHAQEASGKTTIEKATDTRSGMQEHLASKEPVITFEIDNAQITGEVRNIKQVKVSYYLMDIELLFSRKPFIKQLSSDFSIIEPNRVEMKNVANGKLVFNIPQELRNSNVMVEVSGEGVSESRAYYAHTMKVAVMKNYGILQVVNPSSKPLSKVYVKVYSKSKNGRIAFHKDGYTDLRGKFDYSSVNTGNIDSIDSFSFLVLSDTHGAVIEEAAPPKK